MSDKVKLPREVVEKMKVFASYHGSDQLYRLHEFVGVTTSESNAYDIVSWLRKGNYEIFYTALVNGYEEEVTPEDKVREVINHWELRRAEHGERSQVIDYDKFGARLYGARCVLEMLNIKIDGVNT